MNQPITPVGLDGDELAHLAMARAAEGRHEEAIIYLKTALQQEPNNPRVNYFLGAEYAQIGLYERAIERMRVASDADRELLMAPFQAGMLLMTLNRGEEAIESWHKLEWLEPQHPLRLLAIGLEALVRDDFGRCREYLLKGIAGNTSNEPLNGDMRKILAELDRRGLLAQAGASSVAGEYASEAGKGRIGLAAYGVSDEASASSGRRPQ